MYLKKAIWLFMFAAAILTIAAVLDGNQRHDRGTIQAEGGAPTPPPIPWLGAFDGPSMIAEGGAPTPPPIPWASAIAGMESLGA